jgi:hypothetical protein
MVRTTTCSNDDRDDDEAADRDDLDGCCPELHLAERAGAEEVDEELEVSTSGWQLSALLVLTTTMSIRPTHMALLHTPVVHVASPLPEGVQYEMRTAAADISAGRSTM